MYPKVNFFLLYLIDKRSFGVSGVVKNLQCPLKGSPHFLYFIRPTKWPRGIEIHIKWRKSTYVIVLFENTDNSKIAAEVFCQKQVFGPYVGYERDRNISLCSLLVRSHAKVPTEGFYDTLKNGPEIIFAMFELLQPARAPKINILCWNLVC